MNYQLTIAIKQRKCNMCSAAISKGTKLFVMSDWPRGQDFPTKKNICLGCAPKLTDLEFIAFLKTLLNELENLKALQETTPAQQDDLTLVYQCLECKQKVKYSEVFEAFQCEGCGELYDCSETHALTLY